MKKKKLVKKVEYHITDDDLFKMELRNKIDEVIVEMRREMADHQKRIEDYIGKQESHRYEEIENRERFNTRHDQHMFVVEKYLGQQTDILEALKNKR